MTKESCEFLDASAPFGTGALAAIRDALRDWSEKLHISTRHYSEEFDFPKRDVEPDTTYMLATVPRSGSTFFSIKLWQTGRMGAPLEYANLKLIENTRIKERLGCQEFSPFWHKIKTVRTSPNGVFGYKMFRTHFVAIGRDYPSVLEDIAPTHVVYLTRENLTEHAISYSRAARSNIWFAGAPATDETVYDAAHIRRCEDLINDQKDFWERVFKTTGTQVHRITYESLCAKPDETIRNVAEFMNISLPEQGLVIPAIDRQRDAKSDEWARRYAAEPEP